MSDETVSTTFKPGASMLGASWPVRCADKGLDKPVTRAPLAPTPMPRRMSFKTESLFGFDQAQLGPDGKAALDVFARNARGAQFELIVVAGHADRIGSSAYNQGLSVERAEAVKAYLVSSGGFEASKISIAGKGESSPMTKSGDCLDSQPAAQLRACLQPDRRVEVEVNAMQ